MKKLEQAAGKGKWCALCRLILRSSPPVASAFASTRDTPGQVKKTCRFCGNQYNAQLPQGDEPKDRALRLYNSYDEEDFYRDEKACAVGAWIRQSRNRSPEEGERKEKKRMAAASRQRTEKPTPEQKLGQRLTEEAGELYRRRHKEMKAKHGPAVPAHLRAGKEDRLRLLQVALGF
jgi:hypothetical protein